ncbi:hypothetical protein F8M41_006904 [Gigaspora margarita]|uniref:Uncharacterized protein n=1 Tax=Gigaspora margarita TaxID=4874 RepID=A0A8H3X8P1_GIGMA|nr:hypothetical protein F8M41_006904 [Gigaspora margarita]
MLNELEKKVYSSSKRINFSNNKMIESEKKFYSLSKSINFLNKKMIRSEKKVYSSSKRINESGNKINESQMNVKFVAIKGAFKGNIISWITQDFYDYQLVAGTVN